MNPDRAAGEQEVYVHDPCRAQAKVIPPWQSLAAGPKRGCFQQRKRELD